MHRLGMYHHGASRCAISVRGASRCAIWMAVLSAVLSWRPAAAQEALPAAPELPVAPTYQEGSFRPLTVALGASAGLQPDGRQCRLAGHSSNDPPAAACVMFAAGIDVSLLWRGRIGALVGLFSVSGQSILAQPAAPDRVSIPLLLDVRPLAFLVPRGDVSFRGRLLTGVGLAIGPSIEVVRTGSDSSTDPGLVFRFQAELPLHGQARNGVSLRFAAHTLATPRVALNSGMVRTSPFVCNPEPCTSPEQGYGPLFQAYFGLVYYP